MAISVRYFARLRDEVGRSEDQVDAVGVATVADVWARVNGGTPLPASVLMAVNHTHAAADAAVRDGDEVAFFPPVTGG